MCCGDSAPILASAGPVVAKDVWVLAENPGCDRRTAPPEHAPLAIRRTAGDMPSRVADNFFWLGRYLERLEGAARLLRITIGRVSRPAPTPHEMAELEVLIACLTQAGLLNAEAIAGLGPAGLGQALLRVAGSWGSIHAMLGQVSRITGLLRDQVTGEMHAVTARGLREVEDALGRIARARTARRWTRRTQAMSRVLAFAATLSGLAAENMVRGGGRLFLDLGRRVERAQAVADQIACALEFPGAAQQPARVEHGLRLALELCDSSITYRSRYLAVLQPAPALDLLLADDGNPRGLAFQLAAMRALLQRDRQRRRHHACRRRGRPAGRTAGDGPRGQRAADQSVAALFLPARLRSLRDAVAESVGPRVAALLRAAADGPRGRHRGIARDRCAGRRDLPRAARHAVRLSDAGRSWRAPGTSAATAVAAPEGAARWRACRAGGVMATRRQRPLRQRGDLAVSRCRTCRVPGDRRCDSRCRFPRPAGSAATPSWETVAGTPWTPAPRTVAGRRVPCSTVRMHRPTRMPRPTLHLASALGARCWRRCSI